MDLVFAPNEPSGRICDVDRLFSRILPNRGMRSVPALPDGMCLGTTPVGPSELEM